MVGANGRQIDVETMSLVEVSKVNVDLRCAIL